MIHRVAVSSAIALIGAIALGTAAVPAQAESAYRYWSFWLTDSGEWSYAQQGPATMAVSDGDIFGWRFGIARESDASAPAPRIAPEEAWLQACEGQTRQDRQVRVAVVLDFGDPVDAPSGESPQETTIECAVVAQGSNGAQTLSAVADIRSQSGLICGFDGYPESECAPSIEVDKSTETSAASAIPMPAITPDHGSTDDAQSTQASSASTETVDSTDSPGSAGSALSLIITGIVVLGSFVGLAIFATRRRDKST